LIKIYTPQLDSLFKTDTIKLVYSTIKPSTVTMEEAVDIFCSVVLPHAAVNWKSVKIKAPFTEEQAEHWISYIEKLTELEKQKPTIEVEFISSQHQQIDKSVFVSEGKNNGLYFGGGVESLTALSQMIEQKPVLLSLTGPLWMNNDHESSDIKKKLEDELVDRFGLMIARVWNNCKELFREGDEYINMFITGGLMYYSCAPLIRELGLRAIFHAMEYEHLQLKIEYDRSIQPKFTLSIPRKGLPPLVSILNSLTKVELLEMLYRQNPQLCSYLYSCLNNTSKRWCGECGKCRRIAAYCDAIGIPKSHIGMQENIRYKAEKGTLTKLFWKNLKKYKSKRKKTFNI